VLRVLRIPYSTNVERVALALAHKGIEVEWVDLDPADRTPVREVSGQDLVPVLVEEDGAVVFDSTRILARLEERFPDPPLYPRDPARRAEVEVFLDWFNRVWKRPPNELDAELAKPAPDAELVEELGAELAGSRDVFEALLEGRDHLFGEFSVADCAAFPFLRYAVFDPPEGDEERFHWILTEHLQPLDAHPRLAEWLERMETRPRG
jgi:glutathione S-transferase